jgi:hypothetical protein
MRIRIRDPDTLWSGIWDGKSGSGPRLFRYFTKGLKQGVVWKSKMIWTPERLEHDWFIHLKELKERGPQLFRYFTKGLKQEVV